MDIKMFYDMKINLSSEEESAVATTQAIIEQIEMLVNSTEISNFPAFFSEYYENDMVEFLMDLQNNKERLRARIREYLL